MKHTFDRTFFILLLVLVAVGFCIFLSALLGHLARTHASITPLATSQALFGIVGGGIALFITSNIHYRFWRKNAFFVLIGAALLTFAVFIPGLGKEYGGAYRWISIAGFSFQPAELFKIAFVLYCATWLSGMREKITHFFQGTVPFLLILGGAGIPLLLQPDTDSYMIMVAASLAMFIVAGGRIRDVFLMALLGILLITLLAFMRPYVKERIVTFINPSLDPQGSGYQIKQSLIAIGSGGIVGRGFGQSIQKFDYLPEAISDSIFAVYAEEFGFVGACALLLLYLAYTLRGYRIATHAPDSFGLILVVGIMTLLIAQVFLNMGAMLGIVPLSGLTLPFVSHGGTSLLITLMSAGIVLNVSKYQRTHRRTTT